MRAWVEHDSFRQRVKADLPDPDQASVAPEILEPVRRHLGVSNRVHDILVAHVVLQGPGVMPVVGKLVASGVPEHVRMDREWEFRRFPCPSDCSQESSGCDGATPLGDESVSNSIFSRRSWRSARISPALSG